MTENRTDIERLRRRHERLQASGALPKYWDAVFYHFPTAGTICVRVFSPTHVAVGLAMLALPKYVDPNGRHIPVSRMLGTGTVAATGVLPKGDSYSKDRGRIISYGRSLCVRNFAGIHADEFAQSTIKSLRQLEKEGWYMEQPMWPTFGRPKREALLLVRLAYRLQKAMVSTLVTPKEEQHASGH